MRTYYVDTINKRNIPIKAENISNLRKKLIREYDADLKRGYTFFVKVLVGPEYGSHYKDLGYLLYHENREWRYDSIQSGYYWTHTTIRRVSPKTGNLLDVNKEWRRV